VSCVQIGDGAVICLAGPQREIHREELGERWCFRCRKRREFIYTVVADTEPSYYEPNPFIRCAACNTTDGDLGFGRMREWCYETA
jgi:hypothetical protein